MLAPRRRRGVVSSSTSYNSATVDSLVISYLKTWEASWASRCSHSEDELRAIRCSLYGAVMRRYISSGEMSFTRSELKLAIKSAKEITKPINPQKKTSQVDPICYSFVNLFMMDWKDAILYEASELSLIFTHLYACVSTRYISTNRTKLKFTKRELGHAEECALKNRARLEKEARQDERDRKIKDLRSKYGSAAESKFLLHD